MYERVGEERSVQCRGARTGCRWTGCWRGTRTHGSGCGTTLRGSMAGCRGAPREGPCLRGAGRASFGGEREQLPAMTDVELAMMGSGGIFAR